MDLQPRLMVSQLEITPCGHPHGRARGSVLEPHATHSPARALRRTCGPGHASPSKGGTTVLALHKAWHKVPSPPSPCNYPGHHSSGQCRYILGQCAERPQVGEQAPPHPNLAWCAVEPRVSLVAGRSYNARGGVGCGHVAGGGGLDPPLACPAALPPTGVYRLVPWGFSELD